LFLQHSACGAGIKPAADVRQERHPTDTPQSLRTPASNASAMPPGGLAPRSTGGLTTHSDDDSKRGVGSTLSDAGSVTASSVAGLHAPDRSAGKRARLRRMFGISRKKHPVVADGSDSDDMSP
jgi:hypothetical protein